MKLSLTQIVEQYHFRLHGASFWVPYWINTDEPPFWKGAPGGGKWSAAALQEYLARLNQPGSDVTGPQWRAIMRQHGLGVDCSGLVYRVLDEWLNQHQQRLADFLLVDQAEIDAYLHKHPQLSEYGERPAGSEPVSLAEVCKAWQKDPAMITNTHRLTDPRIVQPVLRTKDIRPGDMIHLSLGTSMHIGVVVAVDIGSIRYADSAHSKIDLGGVQLRHITVLNPEAGLEAQQWQQLRLYHPGHASSRDGVWRLKELAT